MPRQPQLIFPVELDHVPDIRLIACDMDGTLLDDEHAIHDEFWPLIDALHARGIVFCPASGRQYSNLLERFEPIADEVIFISENGTYVVRNGIELCSDGLETPVARALVRVVRELKSGIADVGAVLCGKHSAYVERRDEPFLEQVRKYYHRLEIVDDLLAVEDDFIKVAVFDFESAERVSVQAFDPFRKTHQVVVSGANWMDVMALQANKGKALRLVQQALGVSREQTMVFGDYLNDLEMMDAAAYSFAMANAHPLLKERARYLSPGNTDNGVVRTIKSVSGIN